LLLSSKLKLFFFLFWRIVEAATLLFEIFAIVRYARRLTPSYMRANVIRHPHLHGLSPSGIRLVAARGCFLGFLRVNDFIRLVTTSLTTFTFAVNYMLRVLITSCKVPCNETHCKSDLYALILTETIKYACEYFIFRVILLYLLLLHIYYFTLQDKCGIND